MNHFPCITAFAALALSSSLATVPSARAQDSRVERRTAGFAYRF